MKINIYCYRNKTVASFDTRSKPDGVRVKHYIYKDDESGAYFHERRFLICDPDVVPKHDYLEDVSDRLFFGKARLVRYREICLPETWAAVAASVEKLEELENGQTWRKE